MPRGKAYKRFPETDPVIIINDTHVKMKWSNVNKSKFESLGYRYTKTGDSFLVEIDHLKGRSSKKVSVTCPRCDEERGVELNRVSDMGHTYCMSCSFTYNLMGKRFGRLAVIKDGIEPTNKGNNIWLCRCECGNIVTCSSDLLVSGSTKSCGCYKTDLQRKLIYEKGITSLYGRDSPNFKSYVGMRFGRLVVVEYVEETGNRKCICDCGNEIEIYIGCLTSGNTKSCGCYKEDLFNGNTNPNWNPEIEKEERLRQREIGRKYPSYTQFIKDVLKRDEYTCQVCNKLGDNDLVAHHIFNYADYKDLRTNVHNGITLCNSCHIEFHFSYMNNHLESCTVLDFDDWLRSKNETLLSVIPQERRGVLSKHL